MVTTTPLPHFFVPTSVLVATGWRNTARCAVDEHRIHWDGVDFEHAQVTAVAYATRPASVNLVQRRLRRRIYIEMGNTQTEIRLGRNAFGPRDAAAQQTAFAAMVAALHAIVEPRLRAEHLRAIAAGGTVMIGALSLNRSGMTHASDPAGRPRTWDHLPMALLEADHVIIESAIESRLESPWRLSALTPNAVLLPELLAEAAAAFS